MVDIRSLVGGCAYARGIAARARGLWCIPLLLIVLGLAGCSGSTPAADVTVEPAAAAEPTSTLLPLDTPTSAPTATLVPTAAPTQTPPPPTDTPVPALAVEPEGFQAWCAPQVYEGTQPDGPDAPDHARLLTHQNDLYRVPIPAAYCIIAFHLNQPVPEGLALRVLDGANPFIEQPLASAPGQADTVWTTLTHDYVVNPPYWEVTYTLALLDGVSEELWSSPVTFAKPLPEPCPYGGLPDPVTLYCAVTDPWEIEPWPDVKYPYDRSRLTPDPDE